jgi:hypothetical protein
MANSKFKTKVQADAGISLPQETAERVVILDASGNLESSAVTSATLAFLDVTSSVQDQLDAKASEADLTLVEEDVADLVTLSGVAANAENLGTFTGTTIPDSSDIKEALQALETELEAIPSPFYYAGTWAASTNTPTLADGIGTSGAVYYVSDAGTVDFGAGDIEFAANDRVAYNGTTWDKWDATDAVASVFGRMGAVTAQASDYDADQIDFAPAGSIAATDVQAAIEELDLDIQAAQDAIDDHIADAADAHDASAISVVPAGNLASTDVQAALEELQDDIDNLPLGSAGDIQETSFAGANNQVSLANVTGFAFANGVVRSFSAIASVSVDAASDLFETFFLEGVQKGASWDMSVRSTGDDSLVNFDITNAGQIQYTSGSYGTFVSLTIKFRAISLSV